MTIREMMKMYHSLKFVEELIDYIEEYPDDDYMTMECLCRKLVKYHLMSKVDGYYTSDRKTEPTPQEYERWLFKEPIEDEPQYDFGAYADRLWEIAYERGKREALKAKDEPQKWTKEDCKGCKYNEYPYDDGTCFVRVCINGNKYEPKQTDCAWK